MNRDRESERALVYAGYMPLSEYVEHWGEPPLAPYERKFGRMPEYRVVIERLDGTRWLGPNEHKGEAYLRFDNIVDHLKPIDTKSVRVERVL